MQDIVSKVRGILSPVGLESYPFKVSIFFNKPHNTFIRGCFVDGQGFLKVEMINCHFLHEVESYRPNADKSTSCAF